MGIEMYLFPVTETQRTALREAGVQILVQRSPEGIRVRLPENWTVRDVVNVPDDLVIFVIADERGFPRFRSTREGPKLAQECRFAVINLGRHLANRALGEYDFDIPWNLLTRRERGAVRDALKWDADHSPEPDRAGRARELFEACA